MTAWKPKVSAPTPKLTPLERGFLAAGLLASVAVWLAAVLNRPTSNDEYLEFWTDRARSAPAVVHILAHFPISIDPPTYHLLAHWSMQLLGQNIPALRLPACAGVLLMQVCLFLLVRRTASNRAAVVAAVLPLAFTSMRFAAEGRPYGLLFGLYAASLLCWYLCRHAATHRARLWAAITLAAVLVAGVLASFFGLLILLPVAAAEAVQIWAEKRWNRGVAAALLCGCCAIPLLLPFRSGALPYSAHYYQHYVDRAILLHTYTAMFAGFLEPDSFYRKYRMALAVGALALALAAAWPVLRRATTVPPGLTAGLLALLAVPVAGYQLAAHTTHSLAERHIQFAIVAVPILVAYALQRYLTPAVFSTAMIAILALGTVPNVQWIRQQAQVNGGIPFWIRPSPEAERALQSDPAATIYVGDVSRFWMLQTAALEPAVRSRIVLVYDTALDLQWNGSDFEAITSANARQFTGLPILTYREMLQRSPHFVVGTSTPWEWLPKQLEKDGYTRHEAGAGMTGTLFELGPPAARP